jgi:thiol:disulfide interchange protein
LIAACVFLAGVPAAVAQLEPIRPISPDKVAEPKAVVIATGEFTAPDAHGKSRLTVTAKLAKGWHIYSITQKKGGPIATKIRLDESSRFKPPAEFKALKKPEVHEYPEVWKGLKVEEHHGSADWAGEIQLAPDVDPAHLEIQGAVYAQACADQCLPPKNYKFTARLAAAKNNDRHASENVWPARAPEVKLVASEQPVAGQPGISLLDADLTRLDPRDPGRSGETSYRNPGIEASISGRIEPAVIAPGETGKLILSVTPSPGWYFYGYSDQPTKGVSRPTIVRVAQAAGMTAGVPTASATTKQKPSPLGGGEIVHYYDKNVEWVIPLTVAADATHGARTIEGLIGLQTCNDTTCLTPHGVRFTGTVTIGTARGQGQAPLSFAKASYAAVVAGDTTPAAPAPPDRSLVGTSDLNAAGASASVAALPSFQPQNLSAPAGLPAILLLSVLGGLLLNLMPCVLPVIGLKVLAFVEQGGRQRRHVLTLNLWYSAGILCVFMVLATLAAFLNLGWGEQFQSTGFNVAMAAVVFVMALSFLGFWEIPIPGFAGSSTATKLAHREGFFGAFCKGVLTTVLATPCSGPFLGTVFGFTLKQPPQVIYLIFGAIAFGMALPYLIIGAFPSLIRFLPKPGAWMDTFKQVMGFVLLGTVVFLFTFMDRDYVVPTFALLAVLWAACWWINRTPLTADLGRRLLAWGQAAAFAGVVGYFSFTLLLPRPSVLPWEPFTIANWNKHTAAGRTVLVDFTADWCLNCKLNLKVAIETDAVRRMAEDNDVVTLLADYSDMSDEIKGMLEALGSRSIPVLAVFPAGDPTRPIVLRDLISKGQVIEAIRQAGPSKAGDLGSVAMRQSE